MWIATAITWVLLNVLGLAILRVIYREPPTPESKSAEVQREEQEETGSTAAEDISRYAPTPAVS